MPTSKSYEKDYTDDCCFLEQSTDENPCWGKVGIIDEVPFGDDDYYLVYCCEGHWDCYDSYNVNKGYKKENLGS